MLHPLGKGFSIALPIRSVDRIFKRYSQALKQKVVSEIESSVFTIDQAQKLYRIGSSSTISSTPQCWARQCV